MVPGTGGFSVGGAGAEKAGAGGVAGAARDRYLWNKFNVGIGGMRAEIQSLVEEIKQSVRLLRRHL